ncbi:MAG: hypothetical protein M3378_06235 [Actinomycetota bacterium]|nr:hypothetical protein [Actinomycetota bacterium]
MRSLLRALAAASAASVVAVMLPSAAAAQGVSTWVSYRAPGPDQVLTVSNPTLSAFVSTALPGKVYIKVTGPTSVDRAVDVPAGCHPVNVPLSLTHNGRYTVSITADSPLLVGVGECEKGSLDPRSFFVAAPPKPPSGVTAVMGAARAVTVSWAKNPEPDIVSYRVQRSVGAGPFQQIGEIPGTSFKDAAVPPGGPIRYQVLAVRRGKTPQETVVSAPSAAATVGGAAAGPTFKRGSGNASGASKPVFTGPPQAGPGAEAAASEGGFAEVLPYAPGEEAEATELGVNETTNNPNRVLAFVAGGLLALVVFMHLWWLKRQAEQPLSV